MEVAGAWLDIALRGGPLKAGEELRGAFFVREVMNSLGGPAPRPGGLHREVHGTREGIDWRGPGNAPLTRPRKNWPREVLIQET